MNDILYLYQINYLLLGNGCLSEKISWIGPMFKAAGQEIIIELRHEISINVVYATSKGSDQPAHTASLIRPFASRLNDC